MTGTNTAEYEMFTKALLNYYTALRRIFPTADYKELFIQVLGCDQDDNEILERTDFSRFASSTAVINGMTQAIVQMHGEVIFTQKLIKFHEGENKKGSVILRPLRKLYKRLLGQE